MSIIEEAIQEADEMREVALESAKSEYLEEKNEEVKERMDRILYEDMTSLEEQDEEGLEDEIEDATEPVKDDEMSDQTPKAFADGEPLCPCPDDEEEIEIDFDKIANEIEGGESSEESHEEVAQDVGGDEEEPIMEEEDEPQESESEEMSEEQEESLDEETHIEFEPQLKNGWSARPFKEFEYELDKFFDQGQEQPSTGDHKEMEDSADDKNEHPHQLMESIETLSEKIEKLSQKNEKYREKLLEANKKIVKTNTENAKLFYQKLVLESGSLNERQKEKLVEALEDVDSPDEAKRVYETMKENEVLEEGVSRAGNTPSGDESLSELVSKKTKSTIRLEEQSENPKRQSQQDQTSKRLKELAGIQ